MPQDSLIGRRLDKYEIIELIGKGGMASVYRARQEKINRLVAIKVLPSVLMHDDTFMSRFLREAKVIAQLEHFHILPVYDYGEYESMPYIVMRYLDGGSVHDLVKRGPLPWHDVTRITAQVASALDYAHARSVVHRDIKPNNILLDQDGNAYLADFGIAKLGEAGDSLTGSGIIGTPAYMAPEQSTSGVPTPAIDVYALGVTVFEMITGQVPYHADTPLAQILMHLQQPIPSLQAYNPEIPDPVDAVIRRALAKTPQERYASAGDFARALGAAASTSGWSWNEETLAQAVTPLARPVAPDAPTYDIAPGIAHPTPPAAGVSKKSVRSGRVWMWAIGGAVLVGGAIIVGLLLADQWLPGNGSAVASGSTPTIEPPNSPLPTPTSTPTVTSTSTPPPDTPAPTDVPSPTPEPATSTPADLPATTFKRGVEMVLVPAGPFLMGRNAGNPNERPEHEVYLDAYYIDVTEVSNRDYQACVEAVDEVRCPSRGDNDLGSPSRFRYYGIEAYNDYPVILVSWEEAKVYCKWRGAHLPTEAQWEKAARWDPDTGDVYLFPWGLDVLDSFYLNYNSELGDTARTRNYPGGLSPVGAYEMAGNVAEWVYDWYQDNFYESSLTSNPAGPSAGEFRVMRGGSYESRGSAVTTTFRDLLRPGTKLQTLGFRCAWTPSGDPTTP